MDRGKFVSVHCSDLSSTVAGIVPMRRRVDSQHYKILIVNCWPNEGVEVGIKRNCGVAGEQYEFCLCLYLSGDKEPALRLRILKIGLG